MYFLAIASPIVQYYGSQYTESHIWRLQVCSFSYCRDEMGSSGKKENTSASVAMVASIPELIVSEEVYQSIDAFIYRLTLAGVEISNFSDLSLG